MTTIVGGGGGGGGEMSAFGGVVEGSEGGDISFWRVQGVGDSL